MSLVPGVEPHPAVSVDPVYSGVGSRPGGGHGALGEVEVADLLSVSLVREMSIQLPLSNLTGFCPC